MKKTPPRILELGVAFLTPPARREDIVGDLHERYRSPERYIAEALHLLPAVLLSQIRRTTDPRQLAIEAGASCICFLSVALAGNWNTSPELLKQALPPALTAEVAFAVANAWAGSRAASVPVAIATFVAACTFLLQAVLAAVAPSMALPYTSFVPGCAASCFALSILRLLSERGQQLRPAEAGGRQMTGLTDRARKFRKQLWRGCLGSVVSALLLAAIGTSSAMAANTPDRILGGAIIAIALFVIHQTWRRWSRTSAEPTYRAQLERRRNDLQSVVWWYITPFLIGLLLFALRAPLASPAPPSLLAILPFVVLSALWSVAGVRISRRQAGELQDEIDSLGDGNRSLG